MTDHEWDMALMGFAAGALFFVLFVAGMWWLTGFVVDRTERGIREGVRHGIRTGAATCPQPQRHQDS